MNDEQLAAIQLSHVLSYKYDCCAACRQAWPCDTVQLLRAYRRLRNAALAIIENPQHVDVPDVVLMLGRALAEEE